MSLISYLDVLVLNFMDQARFPFGTSFFKVATLFGEWGFVLVILILILISFPFIRTSRLRLDVLILWVITCGGAGTTFILKVIFQRIRPAGALIVETSSSFPSAHAAVSVFFYAFTFYLLEKKVEHVSLRYLLILAGFIFAIILGLSRIYLGVHYLSDVIAGYGVGIIWFTIGVLLKRGNVISKTLLRASGIPDAGRYSP